MEWIIKECVETAGCELEVSAAFIGEDVLICLKGGERPHLGCSVSATSSVLNFPGHKDEVICRWMAEQVSKELGKRVVCTGGFHKDGISEKEIREVQGSVVRLTEMVIEGLQR